MSNYVNNKEFHQLLKDYSENQTARTYNAIGKIFLKIAENFLNRPCYINYTKDWKDDMVSEAIYDMVRYMHNYNVEVVEEKEAKTGIAPNPFGYFSIYANNGISRYLGQKKKDKNVLVRLNFIENMDKRDE